MKLIQTTGFVTRKDLEDFNISLVNIVNKLTNENQFLKDKLDHMEKLLVGSNEHLVIGGDDEV